MILADHLNLEKKALSTNLAPEVNYKKPNIFQFSIETSDMNWTTESKCPQKA